MVAKWWLRWAHSPKVRGSKPRYAFFFFNRDSMAEWIMCLTTDQEIPGSSPGRVDKIFFFWKHRVSISKPTSRLQSERSTNWAIPRSCSTHFYLKSTILLHILQKRFRTFLYKIHYACVLRRDRHSVPQVRVVTFIHIYKFRGSTLRITTTTRAISERIHYFEFLIDYINFDWQLRTMAAKGGILCVLVRPPILLMHLHERRFYE